MGGYAGRGWWSRLSLCGGRGGRTPGWVMRKPRSNAPFLPLPPRPPPPPPPAAFVNNGTLEALVSSRVTRSFGTPQGLPPTQLCGGLVIAQMRPRYALAEAILFPLPPLSEVGTASIFAPLMNRRAEGLGAGVRGGTRGSHTHAHKHVQSECVSLCLPMRGWVAGCGWREGGGGR